MYARCRAAVLPTNFVGPWSGPASRRGRPPTTNRPATSGGRSRRAECGPHWRQVSTYGGLEVVWGYPQGTTPSRLVTSEPPDAASPEGGAVPAGTAHGCHTSHRSQVPHTTDHNTQLQHRWQEPAPITTALARTCRHCTTDHYS